MPGVVVSFMIYSSILKFWMIEWDEKFEPIEDRTPVTRSHPEEISGRCKRRAVGGVAVGNLEAEM